MISGGYEDYLKSPEWQQKRSERLRLDGYKCQRCGRPMDLQVHHLTYNNIGHENIYTDLITLCKRCHEAVESQKREYDPYEDYRRKKKLRAFYMLRFCRDYERNRCDIAMGGTLNMMDNNVIRAEWKKWIQGSDIPDCLSVTAVKDYFGKIRIRVLANMEKAGASPDEIMARGISRHMISKYYNKPDEVERGLNRTMKMED